MKPRGTTTLPSDRTVKSVAEEDSEAARWGFPVGSEVKSLLDYAGDSGSMWDPRGSHMPQSNQDCVPEPWSLCPRAWEAQLMSPCAPATEA